MGNDPETVKNNPHNSINENQRIPFMNSNTPIQPHKNITPVTTGIGGGFSPATLNEIYADGKKLLSAAGITRLEDVRGCPGNLVPANMSNPLEEGPLLLAALYDPMEYLFIGKHTGNSLDDVQLVSDWLAEYRKLRLKNAANSMELQARDLGRRWPVIQPNPLTGGPVLNKKGMTSVRCNKAVCRFRFATGELEIGTPEEQLAIWAALMSKGLKISALISPGGEGRLHAWIRIDAPDRDAWHDAVDEYLYYNPALVRLGCKTNCSNESCNSLLPGVITPKTGARQRLLWLAPQGGIIA